MINMNVIMIADGCRGVRRVRRGVPEQGNSQTRYEKVWVGEDMYVLCEHGRENSRDVMHVIDDGTEGTGMSWGGCIWVRMGAG